MTELMWFEDLNGRFDRFLAEYLVNRTNTAKKLDELLERTDKPVSVGQTASQGRTPETTDIADFMWDLKVNKGIKSQKDLLATCKKQFPGRVTNVEQLRGIWRRHLRRKNRANKQNVDGTFRPFTSTEGGL
jgi:hypothetical protein